MIIIIPWNKSIFILSFSMDIKHGLFIIFTQFKDFFWGIGFFGWQLAVVYCTYALYYIHLSYSVIFFITFIFFGLFNKILKQIYYSPRPKKCMKFLDSEPCLKGKNGMPSGHAQITAFALTVAYLFTHQYLYQSIFIFFVTILQRFVYNNHTLLQLCVGSILGITIGGLFYEIVKRF